MPERICPCGSPAANPRGVPRCAECVLENKRRWHRERKARESRDHRKRKGLPGTDDEVTAVCTWCERDFSYVYLGKGLRVKCDECKRRSGTALVSAWAKKHPDRVRVIRSRYNATPHGKGTTAAYNRRYRFRKYGTDEAWFDATLAAQGGRCAICSTAEPGGKTGAWHIDHDRSCCLNLPACGKCNRGILCANCNSGLGLYCDDPARLRSAAEYLERHLRSALWQTPGLHSRRSPRHRR